MSTLPIRIRAVCRGIVPTYATPGAAGLDLHMFDWRMRDQRGFNVPEEAWQKCALRLCPGEIALIRTGAAFEVPEGMEGQVRGRSGLASKHGVAVLNSPGTIDSDYRGEVGVTLINHGDEFVDFAIGDRVAQIVFAWIVRGELVDSESLSETARGAGGFGSTGR